MRFLLFLLMVWSASGATYYVAPGGSDSADGSQGTPWGTQQKAWNTMVPGDTTLVQAGIYTRSYHWDQTTTNGTPSQPITMRAVGGVTNSYGVSIRNSYVVYDGFNFCGVSNQPPTWNVDGGSGTIVYLVNEVNGNQLTNVTVANCKIWGDFGLTGYLVAGPPASAGNVLWGTNGPVGCVFTNCSMINFSNCQAFLLTGYSNTVVNCFITNGENADFFYVFGISNIIRGCYCKWLVVREGAGGYHPDFFQSFCTGGSDSGAPNSQTYGHIIEGNYVSDIQGGLMQLEYYPIPTNTVPVCGFYTIRNNIFRNVTQCSIDLPGLAFVNNVFDNCFGLGLQLYAEADWSRRDATYWPGAATNTVILNNVFMNNGWYNLNVDTNFSGPWGLQADYNCFVNDSGTNWVGRYSAPSTNLNWNTYPQGPGYYWAVNGIFDEHCLTNGADLRLAGAHNYSQKWDYRPMLGSALIDAGTNTSNVADIESAARPMGATNDIGAFEYDPTLLLYLDFNEGFASSNSVLDVTGNGHDALRFNYSTNWMAATNGIFGTMAGAWSLVTTQGDGGSIFDSSQYAGITNIGSLEYLTNGTISVWATFAAKVWQSQDSLLDNGFNPTYASNPSAATNSWRLGRSVGGMAQVQFTIYRSDSPSDGTRLIEWPVESVTTTNLNLYTVTWNAASNTVVGYFNGSPFQTNTLSAPWLHIYGKGNQRWLCIGANCHDGTPEWGDDLYPNDNYHFGAMDDIRIYDRDLSGQDVVSLYVGNGATVAGGSSPPPAPPSTSSSTLMAFGGKILRGVHP